MAGFKIRISKKTGNVVAEAVGFTGEACIGAAEQVIAKLKEKGVIVDTLTFHRKSEECGEMIHILDEQEQKG